MFNPNLKPVKRIEVAKTENKTFYRGDFNNIEVIYCEEDWYVNASKMIVNANKIYGTKRQYRDFIHLQKYKIIEAEFNKIYNKVPSINNLEDSRSLTVMENFKKNTHSVRD